MLKLMFHSVNLNIAGAFNDMPLISRLSLMNENIPEIDKDCYNMLSDVRLEPFENGIEAYAQECNVEGWGLNAGAYLNPTLLACADINCTNEP